MNDYEKQANDFLTTTKTEFSATFKKNGKHFADDKETRDIYKITLKRGDRKFSFDFGQSLNKSQYYQDKIPNRTYTLSGGERTGGYRITDLAKYTTGGNMLKIVSGEVPTAYDILACLTKYDPGDFANFCGDFGYDTDIIKAKKTYKAVKKEFAKLQTLFSTVELELLQEIN